MPPTPPTTPIFEIVNNTFSRISWNLTNETADAGPQYLTVNVDDNSMQLEPHQTSLLLPTEPGVTYAVTVTAANVDGSATSQPAYFNLPFQG